MIASFLSNSTILFQGTLLTLQLWLTSLCISLVLGTVLGIAESDKSGFSKVVQLPLRALTRMIRAIPFYLQLLIIYFVLPMCTGADLSAFTASVLALGFCSSAYVSQIVRGGLLAYDQNLWEMTQLLGYTRLQALRYLVVPQVFRANLLALSGEVDQLIKTTAVCSTIGVLETMGTTRNIIAREMNPIAMYLGAAVIFICLSLAWSGVVTILQQRMSYARN